MEAGVSGRDNLAVIFLDESMVTSLNLNPLEYDLDEAGTIPGANRFTNPSEKTCRKPGISATIDILVNKMKVIKALISHTKQWRI
jgi:hypothetical protein